MGVVTAGSDDAVSALAPAWSADVPSSPISVVPLPPETGGCVVFTATTAIAFAVDGRSQWEAAAAAKAAERAVCGPAGSLLSLEHETIIERSLTTGATVHSFAAPRGTLLSVAPWGDLLYLEAGPGQPITARCIDPAGGSRWSVPLPDASALAYGFHPVGDVVVIEQRGALWAFDRAGRMPWTASPSGAGGAERSGLGHPSAGFRVSTAPRAVGPGQLLVELTGDATRGLYLFSAGDNPGLKPVTVSPSISAPYAIVSSGTPGPRVVGMRGASGTGPLDSGFRIGAIDMDGVPAWEHHLPDSPRALLTGPADTVIVAISPTPEYWATYSRLADLTGRSFLLGLNADGTARWRCELPGPITHYPVAGIDGTAYVLTAGRLWAVAG